MPDQHPADQTDHVQCERCGVICYHCDDCGQRCWSDDEEEELCSDCFGRNRLKEALGRLVSVLDTPDDETGVDSLEAALLNARDVLR